MVSREGDLTLVHCTVGGPAERNYDIERDLVTLPPPVTTAYLRKH